MNKTKIFLADDHAILREGLRHILGTVPGYEVVGVLQTSDGRHLLVSRGFAQRPAGQDFPQAAPAPPTGTVTIVGHVRRDSGHTRREGEARPVRGGAAVHRGAEDPRHSLRRAPLDGHPPR